MATLTLHHGDCLELMKTLPDKSIDLFLCDLPYGCLSQEKGATPFGRNTKGPSNSGCKWDVPIDLAAFWVQVKRLCKNDHTPVLMFCTTKFGNDLINSNPDWFRYDLVWSKSRAVGFLLANKMPIRSHEMIYVFSKKGANYTRIDITGDFPESVREGHVRSKPETVGIYGKDYKDISQSNKGKRCVKSVVEVASATNKGGKHPTQKPDNLYEWLITRYSKEGDTILDPTAGSFASCFTAQRLGRNAIGIEMDKAFYDKAVKSV
jgi:site-specific DNA-methyltransferase (adenine-specific)